MSEGEKLRQLRAVLDYEERYHKPLWAGRAGTSERVLDSLTDEGLLLRTADEHRLRWWYSLTPVGRQRVARS